jgi:hypothetical protein
LELLQPGLTSVLALPYFILNSFRRVSSR